MRCLLFIVCLLSVLHAQNVDNSGEEILFGTTFTTTDSLFLDAANVTDTVRADTLYTGAIDMSAGIDGVHSVAAKWNETSSEAGTLDSLYLDVRYLIPFRMPTRRAEGVTGVVANAVLDSLYSGAEWTPWNTVHGPAKADSLYRKNINSNTFSWWGPAGKRQYRTYGRDTSTDTARVKITDYLY